MVYRILDLLITEGAMPACSALIWGVNSTVLSSSLGQNPNPSLQQISSRVQINIMAIQCGTLDPETRLSDSFVNQ